MVFTGAGTAAANLTRLRKAGGGAAVEPTECENEYNESWRRLRTPQFPASRSDCTPALHVSAGQRRYYTAHKKTSVRSHTIFTVEERSVVVYKIDYISIEQGHTNEHKQNAVLLESSPAHCRDPCGRDNVRPPWLVRRTQLTAHQPRPTQPPGSLPALSRTHRAPLTAPGQSQEEWEQRRPHPLSEVAEVCAAALCHHTWYCHHPC